MTVCSSEQRHISPPPLSKVRTLCNDFLLCSRHHNAMDLAGRHTISQVKLVGYYPNEHVKHRFLGISSDGPRSDNNWFTLFLLHLVVISNTYCNEWVLIEIIDLIWYKLSVSVKIPQQILKSDYPKSMCYWVKLTVVQLFQSFFGGEFVCLY